MLPTELQVAALGATPKTCNEAASWLSAAMHTDRVLRKYDAHKRFYTELKQRFGLSAQPAIRVIGKVAAAHTTLNANIATGNDGPPGSERRNTMVSKSIEFRPDAAQPFDARCLSWQITDAALGRDASVSIWTTHGRMKRVAVLAAARDLVLLRTSTRRDRSGAARRQVVSVCHCRDTRGAAGRSGQWLHRCGHGYRQHRTTSDGDRAAGAGSTTTAKRQQRLRRKLQAKKTASARRLLKKRRRKETRFATDINHQVSKRIVAEAQRTGRGIAVEQLGGIRDRVRLRKPQRVAVHSWAFAQLGRFLAYKAQAAGVALVQVDPAYTSQTCSRCGRVTNATDARRQA